MKQQHSTAIAACAVVALTACRDWSPYFAWEEDDGSRALRVDPSGGDDGPAIAAAIAAAQPGDTLVLGPGTYQVGPTVFIDEDGNVHAGIPPLPFPDGESIDAMPLIGAAYPTLDLGFVLVDVPGLTIRGEFGAEGEDATVITSLGERFDLDACPRDDLPCIEATELFSSQYVVFVNVAPDIRYSGIRFENAAAPLWTGEGSGGAVTDCILDDQFGNPRVYTDDRAVDPATPFVFAHNTWRGVNGPHVDAAADIHDNTFDSVLFGLYISAHAAVPFLSGTSAQFGEVADVHVFDNEFDGGPFREAITAAGGFWGGEIRDVTIEDNVISGRRGVDVNDFNVFGIYPTVVEGIEVADNKIDFQQIGVYVDGTTGTVVRDNRIQGPGVGTGILVTGGATFTGTISFDLLIRSANGSVVTDNRVTGAGNGLRLGAGARDCTVADNVLGANVTDVVLRGTVPVSGASSVLLAGVSGCDLSLEPDDTLVNDAPCTNVALCPDLDDDGDGAFGEDPGDGAQVNDDGDTVVAGNGAVLGLVDEDPTQMTNIVAR